MDTGDGKLLAVEKVMSNLYCDVIYLSVKECLKVFCLS